MLAALFVFLGPYTWLGLSVLSNSGIQPRLNRRLLWEIERELTAPITKRELKREERRSVYFLGLLAVVVTIRVGVGTSTEFSVLGIDYKLIPVLNILIVAWIVYAAFMLVFISDDFFAGRRGNVIRRLARLFGLGVGFETPAILLWVMVITPSIFTLPLWVFEWIFVLPFVLPIVYLYIATFKQIRAERRERTEALK